MVPHHRTDDDGDVLHEREEDRNPWAKAAIFADRYKVLWVLAMSLAAWLGSRVIQPLNAITEVSTNQAAILVRITATEKTQNDMAHAIQILTKIACVKNLTAGDQYAFGVTCADLPLRQPER